MITLKFRIAFLLFSILFLATLTKAQTPTPTPEDDQPIKVDTLLLTVPLSVSDSSGRNVPGLKKENFSVFQNGRRQEIEFFFNEEAPMNVAILIDTSYSTKDVLDKIQKAARDFIKVLRPEDKGIIVTFDYQTRFLSSFTSDRKELSRAIERSAISDKDGSDVHDAIAQVVNNNFAAIKGRKAIIVLTDGMVSGRNLTAQQSLETLQKSDTIFYPIVFKTKSYNGTRTGKNAPLPIKILQFLAEETSGRFFEKESGNLKEAFQGISEEMKKQYLIGFYPQNTVAGKAVGFINLKVEPETLSIKTKKLAYIKEMLGASK